MLRLTPLGDLDRNDTCHAQRMQAIKTAEDAISFRNEATIGVRVIIQDPHLLMRDCLRMILSRIPGISVVADVATVEEALAVTLRVHPDILLIELSNGSAAQHLLKVVTREAPDTRVMCLADDPEHQSVREAIDSGASGLALKTGSPEELIRTLQRTRDGVQSVVPEIAAPILQHYLDIIQEKRGRDAAIIEALASAVDAKDAHTGQHTKRVARIAATLASAVDPALTANEPMYFGFVLHDIGKIGIPESILLKQGPLNDDEWRIMETHPLIGMRIISPLGLPTETESVVRFHHERWDGTGYPDHLPGEEIPLPARIFSLADTFDAMTHDRPYRRGRSLEEAVSEIRSLSGQQFDPDLVPSFVTLAMTGSFAPKSS